MLTEASLNYAVASLKNYKYQTVYPAEFMEKQYISPVLEKLLDEDTRALFDAGYLDGALGLTYAGEMALKVLAFEQHKAALVALAKAKLAEKATTK